MVHHIHTVYFFLQQLIDVNLEMIFIQLNSFLHLRVVMFLVLPDFFVRKVKKSRG